MSIRSEYEVDIKLEKLEVPEDSLKEEIVVFFKNLGVVLPDNKFIDYYLMNLSSSKGYSFNNLYVKLSKRVRDKNLLKQKLLEYFKENEVDQLGIFIQKNLRKLLRMESSQKRIHYLVNKGFKFDLVRKFMQINNL